MSATNKVAIISKTGKPELATIIPHLLDWLRAHKYEALVDRETAAHLKGCEVVEREEIAKRVDLFDAREICRTDNDVEICIALRQLSTNLLQPIFAARDQHERAGLGCKLSREFSSDAGRRAGDQRSTAVECESTHPWRRIGSSTRQTVSAMMWCPAAVG